VFRTLSYFDGPQFHRTDQGPGALLVALMDTNLSALYRLRGLQLGMPVRKKR
jgi:hypothetical protein